jgi:hypothetical protein
MGLDIIRGDSPLSKLGIISLARLATMGSGLELICPIRKKTYIEAFRNESEWHWAPGCGPEVVLGK